jgi:hypothetical protein
MFLHMLANRVAEDAAEVRSRCGLVPCRENRRGRTEIPASEHMTLVAAIQQHQHVPAKEAKCHGVLRVGVE